MYTLRTQYPKGEINNEELGKQYTRVLPESIDAFQDCIETVWPNKKQQEEFRNDLHGFIVCGRTIPLYYNWHYYVMTSDGGTFENLTHNN